MTLDAESVLLLLTLKITHQEFQISNVISNTTLMCLSSKLYLENFGYHSEENNLSLGFYISPLSYDSYCF